MSGGILILGAGQAAAQLAISLRQGGHDGPIRMVGDEPYAPYQRPPLSKAFLKERPAADSLLLRGAHYWADHKVELELGTAAATVDRARKLVSLRDGRTFDYDTLVFATGTRARDLPLPGIELPGVFSLRKIDDVRRLRPALDDARRIVIVGGGYIGLEVAAVMRQEGRDAIVVEAEGRVMKRVAGEAVSGFFDALHRSRGVDIRLGCRLASIDGDDRATGITLASGERIAADLILVATGARANDDIAKAAGLPCEEGIVVDDFARAAPDVYAIGDCARFSRTATAARSGSNACRTPSIRPRPRPTRSWASRSPTIRCRGSGPTSTRSSCRSPACSTASTPPRRSAIRPTPNSRSSIARAAS